MVYFKTVAWCYPFWVVFYAGECALQGRACWLRKHLLAAFELAVWFIVVAAVVRPFGYVGVCFADLLVAWLAALNPHRALLFLLHEENNVQGPQR